MLARDGGHTDAFLGARRMHLAKKEQKQWIFQGKHGGQTNAPWVPIECAIGARRMHLDKKPKFFEETFDEWGPFECAFGCHTDAPKNREKTTPSHKKEFSTCSAYLKIKYIKKRNR